MASGKGGTGKSTFAANLGLTLAHRGKKTVLLDMNMGMRALDLYIGVENVAIFDMYDVIMRTCEPETALIRSDLFANLCLMPTRQGREWDEISTGEIVELVDYLRTSFDYIIMDGPPGMGRAIDMCLACSDHVVLVTTPDYAAIRDADALEDHLIKQGVFSRFYVINRMMPELEKAGGEPEPAEIARRFRCELLGMILEDGNIRASTNIGVPIVAKRDTYIARNFDRMAEKILAW